MVLETSHLRYYFLFTLVLCLFMPGCGGCNNSSADKSKSQKELEEELAKGKDKKEPFEISELMVKPDPPETEIKIGAAKPGHWIAGSLRMVSNRENFQGNIQSQSMAPDGVTPIPTENTPYNMLLARPVSLPKEEKKDIELMYYVPRRPGKTKGNVALYHQLSSRGTGRVIFESTQGARIMPDYQYYMVVLSSNPAQFGFMNALDCVEPPYDGLSQMSSTIYYRLSIPKVENKVPLPNESLTWTSIAYVFWDDIEEGSLNQDQKTAMIDWLHWGGQLIVSGPDGLSKLKNSFLADYLPVTGGKPINLTADDFSILNENWSIPIKNTPEQKRELSLPAEASVLGVNLELKGDAKFIDGTGEMVAERSVGRGRIAVTSFSINSRAIRSWKSFDGFINACLLRRPAREFRESKQQIGFTVDWKNYPGLELDPLFSTTVRYLSRDMGDRGTAKTFVKQKTISDEDNFLPEGDIQGMPNINADLIDNIQPKQFNRNNVEDDHWHYGGYQNYAQSGVAGWNDNSGVALASRNALKEAAGISPPSADFVLKVLIGYLIILVPVNWLFFRLIGRVELAWAAAPVLAIIGAIVVAKLASLDIGFARSRTEVAVLEMHGGYSRGHLTRYSALYTSLTTRYDLAFSDSSAQAQPFAARRFDTGIKKETATDVTFRRDRNWTLESFRVPSNSTEAVHSEQMLDLGGGVRLNRSETGEFTLVNDSDLSIRDAGVLYRDLDGTLKKAWVGDLESGESSSLSMKTGASRMIRTEVGETFVEDFSFEEWDDSATTLSLRRETENMMDQYDFNENNVLERDELTELPEIEKFVNLVNGLNYNSGTDIIPEQEKNDDLLSFPELMECCRLARSNDSISLGGLFEKVSQNLRLAKGQARLVGWSDSELPSLKISPIASQAVQQTFLLIHLKQGDLPKIERDASTRFDIDKALRSNN